MNILVFYAHDDVKKVKNSLFRSQMNWTGRGNDYFYPPFKTNFMNQNKTLLFCLLRNIENCKQMRNFQVLLLLLVLIVVASCTTSPMEEFVVGKNFIKDQAGITKIDTLSLQSSVVKFDSVISNSSGKFLIGSNYNPFSGYKNSNSYLTLKFDGSIDNTKFVYDSLCLVLSYDSYFAGDTLVPQKFSVHPLTETMTITNSYLYTTSKFKYDTTPLGSVEFKPRPRSKEQLTIRLSDKFGERLANMIKAKKDTVTSSDLFVKYILKGIVIKPEPNVDGAILRFRTADITTSTKNKNLLKPEMRLYYHLVPNPNELKDLYYKFSFNSDGIYFNQIEENNKNSAIDGIESYRNEIASKLTGNQTIVQSGVQLFTKLKIPYLDNLSKGASNPAVVGAFLRLFPIKGTYTKASELPDSLYIYSANKNNSLLGQVTLPGQSDKYVLVKLARDGNRKITVDDKDRVYYEVDVSAFVEAELAVQTETTNSLFIGFGSTNSKKTAEHVLIGGVNSGKYSPALSVFYYHN
jgi:hypothetical protein